MSWNKPFKQAYRSLYDEWMATGDKSYTPAGNLRAPKKTEMVHWVRQAWDSVPVDVIIHSFKVCGISVKPDGSEDSEIHVLKQDGVASEAANEVFRLTREMTTCNAVQVDEAHEDKDLEKLETNELVCFDE
jgi:hypothetical protein